MGPEVLARKKFGTYFSAVSSPAPLMLETNSVFHSASLAATASASDDTRMPVRMLTLWRSTISWALRTQLAGLPCVSSKMNSTGRPSTPPRSLTSSATSLHVRTTWWPSAAHVPVTAVGTPILMGPPACAQAWRRSPGPPAAASATAPPVRKLRLETLSLIALLLSPRRGPHVNAAIGVCLERSVVFSRHRAEQGGHHDDRTQDVSQERRPHHGRGRARP